MEQRIWVLQSLNGMPIFPDVEITMEFRRNFSDRGDTLGGHAVCNGYGVPYEIDGHELTVVREEFESSAEGCLPESYNDLEQQYYDVLSRVESYELEGDVLTLTTEAGETLVFTPQNEETVWVLQSINAKPALPDAEVTLEFLPNSHALGDIFRGNAVCNSYGGLYERNGHRLTVREFQNSLVRCPSIEDQYFDIFPRVSTYEIDSDTLTLTSEAGDVLVFTPQKTARVPVQEEQ